jgi:hypothetical protein
MAFPKPLPMSTDLLSPKLRKRSSFLFTTNLSDEALPGHTFVLVSIYLVSSPFSLRDCSFLFTCFISLRISWESRCQGCTGNSWTCQYLHDPGHLRACVAIHAKGSCGFDGQSFWRVKMVACQYLIRQYASSGFTTSRNRRPDMTKTGLTWLLQVAHLSPNISRNLASVSSTVPPKIGATAAGKPASPLSCHNRAMLRKTMPPI